MAQERARRARRLAGRYGAAGRVAAVAALVIALAVVAVAALVLGGGRGVTIERSGEGVVEAPAEEGAAPEETGGRLGDGTGEDGSAAGEPAARATGEGAGEGRPADAAVVVHVDGAVAAPGVYELGAGARVNDAVLEAGGLVEGADTTSLNLAAALADGEKVHVPFEGEQTARGAGGDAAAGDASDEVPVNINTADVAELDELPGVGEATAAAIVEDRERNGPFAAPEDLMRVSGIGEKKFEKLEGLICV